MTTAPLGVAVVGFGFMGRTHAAAIEAARRAGMPVRLHTVCSRQVPGVAWHSSGGGNFDAAGPSDLPADLRWVTDVDLVLRDPTIGAVSICTYTDSHVDLAIAALAAGKHVLVEKPVALRLTEVERLQRAAHALPMLRCMPAMCVRFWPGWRWLRDRVRDLSLGPVRSAVFRRLGGRPDWGLDFYSDESRTGGALFDLHIHDADFIRWCFGAPFSLTATGDTHHLTACYRFSEGPMHVVAEGGWVNVPGAPFRMEYTVEFDNALADFDLARESPLLLTRDGHTRPVDLPGETAYEAQMAHFLSRVLDPSLALDATMDDAAGVTAMLERELKELGS